MSLRGAQAAGLLFRATAPHEPLTITHAHAHPDGHGGTHSHPHSHAGDNWHTGGTHQAAPGSPDTDMPGAQLNSAAPGGETRDVYAAAVRLLQLEGVDVDRELAKVDRAWEARKHQTRANADRARDLALDLKRAESKLLFESRGFSEGCPGFDRARLGEAEARAARLRAALEAACFNDPDLARQVRRQVA